jgi:hypothetical protein
VAGGQVLSGAARELGEARKGMPPSSGRTTEEVAEFFDGMTLVEPGLTEVWDWRPDEDAVVNDSDVMTLIGGVARKD